MNRFSRPLGWSILVLVAALLPRLYRLGTFLTIDELKWAEGAAQFLLALAGGDLAQTYWHFFPGVTIAWGGALILWGRCIPAAELAVCVQTQVENLPDSIGWLRLSTVFLTSLGVMGVYILGRKLFAESLALLTAFLLAFDPFFLAHSRILNGDAVAAIFMFLSLLAFLSYWWNRPRHSLAKTGPILSLFRPALILSSLMAGLAWLTKLPAPLIGLFIGGLGLIAIGGAWRRDSWGGLGRWTVVMVGWGGLALGVFVMLWPAMWVAPLQTLARMYVDAFEVGSVGEGQATFFQGQTMTDPGAWFYPYALAFRLTPVIMIGFLIGSGWLLFAFSQRGVKPGLSPSIPPARGEGRPANSDPSRSVSDFQLATGLVMVAFIVFIIFFAAFSPKKLDRYVMAVIPPLIFLAALGWIKLVSLWPSRISVRNNRLYFSILGGIVVIQLLSAAAAAPYYLTYYNPILGGAARAVTQTPVGWGEGLERAAYYLNGLPDAPSLRVSSWYSDIFQPYFVGRRASFADDGRAQLAADYVVFYINQIQRQKPYSGLVEYFRAGEPVFVVALEPPGRIVHRLEGEEKAEATPWVEVYKAPAAQSAGGAPRIEGVAQLMAYRITDDELPVSRVNSEGEEVFKLAGKEMGITLFLRALGPLPEGVDFEAMLKSATGTESSVGGRWQTTGMKGEWAAGKIVEWHGRLSLPSDTPPGKYRLGVALRLDEGPPSVPPARGEERTLPSSSQARGEETIAEFSISENDPPILIEAGGR